MEDEASSPIMALSPPSHTSSLALFFYGLVLIGSTVVLAVYNLIILICSAQHRGTSNEWLGFKNQNIKNSISNRNGTFKYQEEEKCEQGDCAVCLSVYENGEEVRQLPRCKHSFHAPCIDMWLYSHSDCPLCRAPVSPPVSHRSAHSEEFTSQGLPAISSV